MKTLLLALLLCLPLLCTAQSTQICIDRPITMTTTQSDTVVILSGPGSGILQLGKYNIISGAKLWEKRLDKTGHIYAGGFSQTKEGGYIFATDFNLVKTDHKGNILWMTPQASANIASILETEDRGYIVTRSWPSQESYITKVRDDGQIEWEKALFKNEITLARAIMRSTSNEYIVVGYIRNSQSNEKDALVTKLDAQGNILWKKVIDIAQDDEALAVIEATNGDYLISGFAKSYDTKLKQGLLIRLDTAGELIWSKVVGDPLIEKEISLIESMEDDGLVALITTDQPYLTYTYRIKVDKAGTALSEEKLEGKKTYDRTSAFYLKNTPVRQVAVARSYEGFTSCLVFYKSDEANCNIETSITASGPLDLCPGQTVTLSAGEGFASYKWSTGQTTRTITASEAGQYKVEVTNEIGCVFTTEATTITVQTPFADDQICYVTVDRATGKNRITWNKTPDRNIASYHIYKRAVGGNVKVATVAFNDPATTLDNSSQPDSRTEYYFIRAVDKCGNESVAGTEHRTVLLQASIGTSGEVNLTWNRYTGAAALRTIIYRGRSHDALAPIAELTSQEDRYIDRSPVAEEKIYQIGIELNVNCNTSIPNARESATMASVLARSNAVNLLVAGLEDDYVSGSSLITIWPNPMTDKATITIDPSQPKPARLQILDVTGRFVRQETVSDHTIILKKQHLPAGFYIIAVTLENGYTLKKKISLK